MYEFLLMLLNLIVTPIESALQEFSGISLTDITLTPSFSSAGAWFDITLYDLLCIFIVLLFTYIIVRLTYRTIKRIFSTIMEVFI